MPQDLLYITHRVPYPPDKGDRIRNWNVLNYLAHRTRVHLACLADEPVSDDTRGILGQVCARLMIVRSDRRRWMRMVHSVLSGRTLSEGAFSSRLLRQTVRDWIRETDFNAVMVSASSLAPYAREISNLPAVVDLIDVDSEKWLSYAGASSYPMSIAYRFEANRLRNLERDLPTWCKAVLLVSEAETQLYKQFAGPGPVYTVTNGVDLEYFQPRDIPTEPACTFVGALDYRPNVDGVRWFAESVWPELNRRRPHLRLRLVGRRPVAQVLALASIPGIEVIGQVPDVRPWLARSAVVIIPLRIARGVQNKVLESLAMAKAVVASPAANSGLKAVPGEHLLNANRPMEWSDSIEQLLDSGDLRTRLGLAGRQFVEAYHSWEKCLSPLDSILDLV
jgi:sugar transferase (PEP-CTERM/EpsH1 system associated)